MSVASKITAVASLMLAMAICCSIPSAYAQNAAAAPPLQAPMFPVAASPWTSYGQPRALVDAQPAPPVRTAYQVAAAAPALPSPPLFPGAPPVANTASVAPPLFPVPPLPATNVPPPPVIAEALPPSSSPPPVEDTSAPPPATATQEIAAAMPAPVPAPPAPQEANQAAPPAAIPITPPPMQMASIEPEAPISPPIPTMARDKDHPPSPPANPPAPVAPAAAKTDQTATQRDQDEQKAADIPLPPLSPKPAAAETVRPEVVRAWEDALEVLERENQAMREKLHIGETDRLSDIKVDSVTQIREDVLRARVTELEKELDKLHMKNDGDLPQKTAPDHPAATKAMDKP